MSIGNNKKASALQMRIQQYIIVNLGKDKVNTAAMGSCDLPTACAGEDTAYTTGFYPAPGRHYTRLALFVQAVYFLCEC